MTSQPAAHSTSTRRTRILLAVRSRQNAAVLRSVLEDEAVVCSGASDIASVTETLDAGVDLVVMSEALVSADDAASQLAGKLMAQPEWSDVAVIVLLKGKRRSPHFKSFWRSVAHRRSVILLETPVKPPVLISVVRACLQDRTRQYALKSALDELEESNRTLESFSYTAAHELRNPLGILDSSFSILERTDLTPKQSKFVAMGLKTASSMDQTLQALLDYGRLQSDTQDRSQLVDMHLVAIQSADGLQTLIDSRDANVSWSALPHVKGNRQLLIQLISNLIKNAIVHNPDGSPQVNLRAEQTDKRWIIHVVDNGPGISEENQKKVFALFDRAGKSRADGSGIGLALCRRIVAQHGGAIKVRSTLGSGSDFYFDLEKAD